MSSRQLSLPTVELQTVERSDSCGLSVRVIVSMRVRVRAIISLRVRVTAMVSMRVRASISSERELYLILSFF